MKIVEISPRDHARLFDVLVTKEAAIRKKGRGTYVRVGPKRAGSARWRHKLYKGSVHLKRDAAQLIVATVRASTPETERKLLSSFLGFVDRHSQQQIASITIHYA
jgi:hypothetical protein